MSTPITQILDEAEVEKVKLALLKADRASEGLMTDGEAEMFARAALSAIDVAGIRAKAIEECALLVDNGQETIRETPQGSQRILTPRTRHNLTGIAYATAIRTLPIGIRADKWMPIETAPKDGTEILAHYDFRPLTGESCSGTDHVSWHDGQFFAVSPGAGRRCARANQVYTHWQPLPLPPALSMGKENGE